ncbi:MAG: DGQHR domain-containing protein [Phycisphaerae bacterium]|nr:DGQHR domain-containing protein [Phycisphaerae bacterium]
MPKAKIGRTKRRRNRPQLTTEERERRKAARKHKTDIRTTFINAGFEHIKTRDKHFTVFDRRGEIDAIYAYENIVVCVEDTQTSRQEDIVDHLRKKVEYTQHLAGHQDEFLQVLRREFPIFRGYVRRHAQYSTPEYHVVHVYSSMNTLDKIHKSRYATTFRFLDYPCLQYFLTISRTIHRSTRFELIKFLGLSLKDIGADLSGADSTTYEALLLPETASSFPTGHKLVSFLVDPRMLLERSYVLRSDSWMDSDCLYQRLLSRNKINSMREYLVKEGRVFVNNIIATLPAGCQITDREEKRLDGTAITKIVPVHISIPREFNAIGIIDGQHRLYSYHEGDDRFDGKIEPLRGKQHLLVTGIVYPKHIPPAKRQRFEAQLFLEINDKQKRVRGDLKQAIERIVQPHSPIAIAKAVVQGLAETGPLTGRLEVHFYDTGKIKTTSIVSYGMRHIVSLDGEHSLFKRWTNKQKKTIQKNRSVLEVYVDHCVSEINMFLGAFKSALPGDMWTTDRKKSRALTTTTINGLIFCLRLLIEKDALGDFDYYRAGFSNMKVSFKPERFTYRSSHWKSLGEELFEQCFT